MLLNLPRLALGALLATALTSAASADTIVVQQVNFTFQPADIVINAGDTVRWVWNGGDHDVTEGTDGTVDGNEDFFGLLDPQNQTFEVVFDAAFLAANPQPGNLYNYFCSPHFFFGMVGTVTVVDQPGTSYCDCPTPAAICGNAGAPGEGCANSSGSGAVLSASGSANALVDDLTFSGSGLLPGQAALLFTGPSQVNGGAGSPFGDGLRCVAGQVTRLPVRIPNAAGEATWGPGLNSGGLWAAGDTRNFQIWYRDSNGSPCGNPFNVSNGYSVTFN